MMKLYFRLIELRDREDGQAMAEYGILLALIAVAVIGTVLALGVDVNAAFQGVVDKI